MSTLKRLADGPAHEAISYTKYRANGYVFRTMDSEINKTTQNSGVSTKAKTKFRASAKDKNLVEDEAVYYGVTRKIIELNYFDFTQTIFYCDWVPIEDKTNGCKVDKDTNLTFVNMEKFKSNSNEDDEPCILASQASQVFYCKDPKKDYWHVVLDAPKRLHRDVDSYDEPLIVESLVGNMCVSSLVEEVMDVGEQIVEGSWVGTTSTSRPSKQQRY